LRHLRTILCIAILAFLQTALGKRGSPVGAQPQLMFNHEKHEIHET